MRVRDRFECLAEKRNMGGPKKKKKKTKSSAQGETAGNKKEKNGVFFSIIGKRMNVFKCLLLCLCPGWNVISFAIVHFLSYILFLPSKVMMPAMIQRVYTKWILIYPGLRPNQNTRRRGDSWPDIKYNNNNNNTKTYNIRNHSSNHSTSKLVPHPQLLDARGLSTILNWLPISSMV